MWKSVSSGRRWSYLLKLMSVLNASQHHCQTITSIPHSTFSYLPHHFPPNASLRSTPKFFSQYPTHPGDPPSSPSESHRERTVHDSGDNAISPDTIDAFHVDIDFVKSQNDGVESHVVKHLSKAELVNDGVSDKDTIDVGTGFANADNYGVEWSDAKHSNEIESTNGGRSDKDASEQYPGSSEDSKNGGGEDITFTSRKKMIRSVLHLLKAGLESYLLEGVMGESVEKSLLEMHLDLNERFVVRIMKTVRPQWFSVHFFHWASKQPGFSPTSKMVHELLLLVKYNVRGKEALVLHDTIMEIGAKEKGILHTRFLNDLMRILSRLELRGMIPGVMNRFDEFGCIPDARSHGFLLKALCNLGMHDRLVSLCKEMFVADSLTHRVVENVMEMLCLRNCPIEALEIYSMVKKNMFIAVEKISLLVKTLSLKSSLIQAAFDVMMNLPSNARERTYKPFVYVMEGLCRFSKLDEGKSLILSMIALDPPPGYGVFHLIIEGFCREGRMVEAMEMIELMKTRGLKPHFNAYCNILEAFAMRNMMDEAMPVFREVADYYPGLNYKIFSVLIHGFCNVGDSEMAMKLFDHMKRCKFVARSGLFATLIRAVCCRGLDWERAKVLVEEMRGAGYCATGMTELIMEVGKELEEVEFQEARKLRC